MTVLKNANLALSFLLELCALAAVGYWGIQTGQTTLAKIVLGIGAPLLVAILWGLFAAPKAPRRLNGLSLLLFKVVVFGLAILALASTGQTTPAIIFAIVVLVNLTLSAIWRQEELAAEMASNQNAR